MVNPIDVIANALGTLDGYPTRWKDDDDVMYALRSDATVVWEALVEHGAIHTWPGLSPRLSAPFLVLPMPEEPNP